MICVMRPSALLLQRTFVHFVACFVMLICHHHICTLLQSICDLWVVVIYPLWFVICDSFFFDADSSLPHPPHLHAVVIVRCQPRALCSDDACCCPTLLWAQSHVNIFVSIWLFNLTFLNSLNSRTPLCNQTKAQSDVADHMVQEHHIIVALCALQQTSFSHVMVHIVFQSDIRHVIFTLEFGRYKVVWRQHAQWRAASN